MNWISCKERLPEFLQKVLFHCIQDGQIKNIYMGYLSNDGWSIYLLYSNFRLSSNKKIMNVTHWMELPELPSKSST